MVWLSALLGFFSAVAVAAPGVMNAWRYKRLDTQKFDLAYYVLKTDVPQARVDQLAKLGLFEARGAAPPAASELPPIARRILTSARGGP